VGFTVVSAITISAAISALDIPRARRRRTSRSRGVWQASAADETAAGYDAAALRRCGGRRPMGVARAEVVPVRLDPESHTALAARADADDTSVNDVIRQALWAWLHVARRPMPVRRRGRLANPLVDHGYGIKRGAKS